ncbi:MAG: hypothetical protein HQ564_03005 [Candidatus Saganbacteria bacterium]|nr:hypothetical protein [Candidatus Saganbacteria bacterium]
MSPAPIKRPGNMRAPTNMHLPARLKRKSYAITHLPDAKHPNGIKHLPATVGNYEADLRIAENPYIHFGKEFGKNEILGLAAGVVATVIVNVILDTVYGGHCPPEVKAPILAITQPTVEKPALIYRPMRKAYKDAPSVEKRSIKDHSAILKQGWKNGWPTLRADMLYHDTSQGAYMGGATYIINPETSLEAAMLQVGAFSLAFLTAAFLEVKGVDLRFKLFSKKLEKLGFNSKSYFESRYKIDPEEQKYDPATILRMISKMFNLPLQEPLCYVDSYIKKINLDRYNSWDPYSRFRQRTSDEGPELNQSIQVNFSRAFQVKRQERSPYNCFGVAKRKFQFPIEGVMLWEADQIPDSGLRRTVRKIEGKGDYHEIAFWRFRAQDKKGLLVTIDVPSTSETIPDLSQVDTPFWIEVKVWKDLGLMLAANDFILKNFTVDPTTKNKLELTTEEPAQTD